MMPLVWRIRKLTLCAGLHGGYLSRVTSRALSSLLLALLAWIPLGRGQAWTSRGDLRDRALFAATALDLASSPARAAHGTSARDLTPPRKPSTPPATTPVADAEHVRAHVQRAWWPTVDERPANWRGFLDARLSAPHDAIAPPRG
jgi:hypothetical protein